MQSTSLTPAPMTPKRDRSAARAREAFSTPGPEVQQLVDLLRATTDVALAAVCVEHEGAFHYLAVGGPIEPFANPSDQAICTLAIQDPEVFSIGDLSHDTRTAEMAVVNGLAMDLRFYASAPLAAPDGELVGRLCLFDLKPRELSERDTQLLNVLARNVAALLELRLRDAEEKAALGVPVPEEDATTAVATGRMAHELRTPLATMSGGLQLLEQMLELDSDHSAAPVMKLVNRSARRMTNLVDSMLRLSNASEPEMEYADLGEVLGDVEHDLAEAIERSEATIIDEGLGAAWCDPGQIRVVLQNLVSNALKFSREGSAPVVRLRGRAAGGGYRIEVDDNGIGISESDSEMIFDLFTRLTSNEGFGIGLSTVVRVIDSHGGDVGVEPNPAGTGSRFWIELPAHEMHPPSCNSPAGPHGP